MTEDPIFRPLEVMLNRGVSQSSSARALCKRLNGSTMKIDVRGGPTMVLTALGDHVSLARPGPDDPPPQVELTASFSALARMVLDDPDAPFRDGSARLSGDAETAEDFRSLLNFARPDPEEELARLVGDAPAHELTQAIGAFQAWARKSAESFGRSLAEYLTEETGAVPSAREIDLFARDVNRLVNDVERAAARLDRLASRASDADAPR